MGSDAKTLAFADCWLSLAIEPYICLQKGSKFTDIDTKIDRHLRHGHKNRHRRFTDVDTKTDTDTDTDIDIDTDTQTHRHTDAHRHRHALTDPHRHTNTRTHIQTLELIAGHQTGRCRCLLATTCVPNCVCVRQHVFECAKKKEYASGIVAVQSHCVCNRACVVGTVPLHSARMV